MERKEQSPREPLGKFPYSLRISREEVHMAYLHKQETGEPIQGWVRRMIRERWAIPDHQSGPLQIDKDNVSVEDSKELAGGRKP